MPGATFSRSDLKVGLIESASPPKEMSMPQIPDIRVSAVSPASARLFKGANVFYSGLNCAYVPLAIGVWDNIHSKRVAPYDSMKVKKLKKRRSSRLR
jgi:2-polyprenyl-6-methoxyphenol hydroxylase-like FAD-dependent oxidoreductase